MSFCIIKLIWNWGNHWFFFKNTKQIDKLHTFVDKWHFDKNAFMVDFRIDIRTKDMLNITPC